MNGTSEEIAPSAVPGARSAPDDAVPEGAGSFRHGAGVFDSDTTLLELAVPYLEEGLAAGELTVLACRAETADVVRRELGTAGGRVEYDTGLIPAETAGPDVFTHLRQYTHRATRGGAGRVRVLAEVPATDDPRQVREEMRIEAVVNHVLADLPLTNLCIYDARRLPADLVASAASTHPHLASGTAWKSNDAYLSPADYVRSLQPVPEPLLDGPPLVVVDDAPTLPELRHRLVDALPGLTGDEEQLEDLRLGISEVAANAFRHGRRPVSARLWSDGTRLVCHITDSGRAFADPLAGFIPAHGFDLGRGGMGLWLARKLFDHVDLVPGPAGLTVRLSTALR
ncbi:anti-sigma factor RsbA family regulatory protein [Geodermatophilus sp. SYSU D00691]